MEETKKHNTHKGELIDSKNGYQIIRCNTCGFTHIMPIPDSSVLDRIYKEEYYSTEKPLYIERMKEDKDWWNLAYSDRYDIFEQNISSGNRSILDVGSGTGYFLLHGKSRGWITKGVEPSRQAAEYSRNTLGLDITEDFLNEEVAKKLPFFDVIHMSEVLEHIPDPERLIRLATTRLKKNGILCIVVPNDFNPIQNTLRKVDKFEPWWIAPPHHINYFNFESLKNLLIRLDYDIILEEATFPIDLFLLMGENYIGNDPLGRICHKRRINFETKLVNGGLNDLKRKIYQSFAGLGIGREIVIFGKNKINT